MQFSNVLLIVVGIAALAINPALDHVALGIAGLFRRFAASRRRRLIGASAAISVASLRAAHDDSSPCGCG